MSISYRRCEGRRFETQMSFMNTNPLVLTHFLLWQVGEYSAVPGYYTCEHPQRCLEISAYLEGNASMVMDGEEFPGQTGSVFVLPKDGMHATKANEESAFRMFFLGFEFREEECQTYPYKQMMEFYRQNRVYVGKDTVNLMTAIHSVLSEIYSASPGYMQAIEHYVELIVMLTWRNFTAPGMSLMPSAYAYNPLYNIPSVYAVVRYIDDHIETVGDIRTLAEELGFSYAYLSHMFSSKAGIKLQDYIRKRKMEYARNLLASGKTTVKEIAAKCGYQNAGAFSRAFLKVIGASPSDYLQK